MRDRERGMKMEWEEKRRYDCNRDERKEERWRKRVKETEIGWDGGEKRRKIRVR
jgi:hypothetical protein